MDRPSEKEQTSVNQMTRMEVHEAHEDLLRYQAENVHRNWSLNEEVFEGSSIHVFQEDSCCAVHKECAIERDHILAVTSGIKGEQLTDHSAWL